MSCTSFSTMSGKERRKKVLHSEPSTLWCSPTTTNHASNSPSTSREQADCCITNPSRNASFVLVNLVISASLRYLSHLLHITCSKRLLATYGSSCFIVHLSSSRTFCGPRSLKKVRKSGCCWQGLLMFDANFMHVSRCWVHFKVQAICRRRCWWGESVV